jgi:hypothetical protein
LKESIMSNTHIALCLVALLATYALAAKLDEPAGSPVNRAAAHATSIDCRPRVPSGSALAGAAASTPAGPVPRARATC